MMIVLVLLEKPHLHKQFNEGRAVAAAMRGNVSRNNDGRGMKMIEIAVHAGS